MKYMPIFLRLRNAICAIALVVGSISPLASSPAAAIDIGPPSLGGNAYFDKVFWYNSISAQYLDRTAAASNSTANDVELGSIYTGDYLYLGMQSPFDTIYSKVGSWGSGGQLVYEYSTGHGFVQMTLSSDPSTDYTEVDPDGYTNVQFPMPTSFAKFTVNGVSAYWVRIRSFPDYDVVPKATELKARAFNLKEKILKEPDIAYTLDVAPTLSGCSTYLGEWNAGNGIHYYALHTDGTDCAISFKPEGYAETPTTPVIGDGYTTTLKDHTANPRILYPRVEVLVKDEMGNAVTDATVNYGMLSPSYTSNNSYYFLTGPNSAQKIVVSKTGYVTENGSSPSGNTGLAANVGTNVQSQTDVRLTGTNTPCATINTGMATNCNALLRNTRLTTLDANNATLSAYVQLYTNAGMAVVADDLSKVGSGDAQGFSDAQGKLTVALAGGTYWYKLTASGHPETMGSFTVTDGTLNSYSFKLTGSQPPPQDTVVSAAQSTVSASPSTVTADNVQTASVTVVVRNASGQALVGKSVVVSSSLGNSSVSPAQVTTDSSGVASFTVKSSAVGQTQLMAVVDGVTITQKPMISFVAAGQCPFSVGARVKLPDDGDVNTQIDSAVYYYGADCKRHAFPNSKVYFTWYADFNGVQVVSASTLASMTLGKNVTYRPGVKMVKFTTENKVYAVAKGGVLRWVKTEAAATTLYGANWNTKIDDISDAFYTNYLFGADINNANEYSVSGELSGSLTIDASL